MKLAHTVKINVFVKPEDTNKEEIKNKLIGMTPFDIGKEKIILNETSAESFSNRKITIYEIELKKDAHINGFLEFLNLKLNEEQKSLLTRQKNRLDDNLDFFIRLDKDKLLKNEYYITDEGNCFHIKINIAAFPKKKEKAYEVIREIFK